MNTSLLLSKAISFTNVEESFPPPGVDRALAALKLGTTCWDRPSRRLRPSLDPVIEMIYRFVLGGLCAGLWQLLAGIASKGSSTNGADNRNKSYRTAPRPRCQPPSWQKKQPGPPCPVRRIGIWPMISGRDASRRREPPNQPPVFDAKRLRAVASRSFLRRRRDLGVTSTYSSGAMYSSERSRVICTGGASWMPLPSP